jgi:hypothetical protein
VLERPLDISMSSPICAFIISIIPVKGMLLSLLKKLGYFSFFSINIPFW